MPVDAGVCKDYYSGQSKQLPVDAGVRKDYYSGQSKQLPVDAGVRKDYYSGQSKQLTVDAGVRKDYYSVHSKFLNKCLLMLGNDGVTQINQWLLLLKVASRFVSQWKSTESTHEEDNLIWIVTAAVKWLETRQEEAPNRE